MVAVDRDRAEARPAPNLGESLLAVAGVYGPNASGKSNVLAAMSWLRRAVRDSLRVWDDEIPSNPCAIRLSRRHDENGTSFPRDNPSSSMLALLAAIEPAATRQ
jgi:hypothetical protein